MKRTQQEHVSRARWAAVGAALAVSLGVGGVAMTNAIVSTGDKAVFVPISSCRLFDLRPAPEQIGPRAAPHVAGESYTQTVRGVNGNCNIPVDASAVAMNVTAVGGTAASFLTMWPSDVSRPLASNLNWVPGSPPTPNKVDVKLSADGKISLFNLAGSVSVLADVVGYYADHNHDDRYYTKAEIDAKFNSVIVMSQGLQFVKNLNAGSANLNQTLNQALVNAPNLVETAIVGPKSQNGVSYGLSKVTHCIAAPTPPATVTRVAIGRSPTLTAVVDRTVRTAAGCYDVIVNDPISTSFSLQVLVAGTSGEININGLTSTWAPVGLIPTSLASTATEAANDAGLAP